MLKLRCLLDRMDDTLARGDAALTRDLLAEARRMVDETPEDATGAKRDEEGRTT